jgi:hypothetical protein
VPRFDNMMSSSLAKRPNVDLGGGITPDDVAPRKKRVGFFLEEGEANAELEEEEDALVTERGEGGADSNAMLLFEVDAVAPSAMDMPNTSCITVLESAHGQRRRVERSIETRDLQAAVKYGVKQRGFRCPRTGGARWKYTHADIVYITDESSRHEVCISTPIPNPGKSFVLCHSCWGWWFAPPPPPPIAMCPIFYFV